MCEEYFYDPAYGNPLLKGKEKKMIRMCNPEPVSQTEGIKPPKKKKKKILAAESS